MVLMRGVIRSGYLARVFSVGGLKVAPQYGPLVLFLASFAVGIGVLSWMIRAGLKATKSEGAPK